MSAANATTTLPNPYTPMAFLPPEVATKMTYQIYAAVGSLAVLIWDILLHLPKDYKLLKNHGIRFSLIIYFIARITSLAYMTGLVIFITAPIGNCNMIRQLSLLYPFTIPLILLLFVIRVSALYNNNKYIVALFTVTWLSVLASSISVTIGSLGVQIGSTKYCLEDKTPWAGQLLSFCPFILDTLIFLATTWAFMRNSYSDVNFRNGFDVMVLGKHLPAFSRSVLRDGQAYFLATLILNLLFIITYYIPDAIITPCTVGIPCFVVVNNMSSYVYRNIRFGIYRDCTIDTPVIGRTKKFEDIVFEPATTRRSPGRTDVGDLEEGHVQDELIVTEKNIVEISLEKVPTCNSRDTAVYQPDLKEVGL